MLEIRQATKGFIVFDTDEQAAIMRFDSHADAADLIAVLVIAESREQRQARSNASGMTSSNLSLQRAQ
jgi:hypothetical protein